LKVHPNFTTAQWRKVSSAQVSGGTELLIEGLRKTGFKVDLYGCLEKVTVSAMCAMRYHD
jgi:hypothetical protein